MKQIKAEHFAFVFCYALLAIMWIGPWFLGRDLETGSMFVGFLGAFLLVIEVIGQERKARVDRFLSQNIEQFGTHLDAIASSFLLIKNRSQEIDPQFYGGDRRETFWVYVAAITDLVLVFAFLKWGAPFLFGMTGKELLGTVGWKVYLIYLAPIVSGFLMMYLPARLRQALWYPWVTVWGISFLFFGWIIVPWLAFVVVTYVVFKLLLLILKFKTRWELGNVFVILGFLMVVYAFVVFISKNAS